MARQAQIEYTSAVKFLRRRHRGWSPQVFAVSSLNGTGLHEVWEGVERFYTHMGQDGIDAQRGRQYKVRVALAQWLHVCEGERM